jgi:hypothetical protein
MAIRTSYKDPGPREISCVGKKREKKKTPPGKKKKTPLFCHGHGHPH